MNTGTIGAGEDKSTLVVDVLAPERPERATTPLFEKSRQALLKRDGARCYICGCTAEEVGPLEAHHSFAEHFLAGAFDWALVRSDCEAGEWGFTAAQREAAKAFDWAAFDPTDPTLFVDNMLVNGLLLCKPHHTGANCGIHNMDHPRWTAQRYLREGYRYTATEVIDSEAERMRVFEEAASAPQM